MKNVHILASDHQETHFLLWPPFTKPRSSRHSNCATKRICLSGVSDCFYELTTCIRFAFKLQEITNATNTAMILQVILKDQRTRHPYPEDDNLKSILIKH